MANPADNKTADTKNVDVKTDGAVQSAAAPAAVSPKTVDGTARPAAAKVDAPKVDAPKTDRAVAEVKAAPKTAKKAVRKAKPAATRKAASARKPAPARKPVAPARSIDSKPTRSVAGTATTTNSKLKDTVMATAQKTADTDYTAKVKALAADAQDRAKATYDKMQTYAGDMTEFTKGNVEALVESGKILGAGLQDMARSEVETAKGAFETVTADVKAMAAVKSPTDLFKLQGEIARRNFDALVARASKNAEVSMKLANDAFAPLSSRLSLAAEKISKVA